MAIQATMEWEYQAGGNAANGGGFDPTSGTPGTNYAWGAGQAVYALTGIANVAGDWTRATCTSRAFVAADVGNIINITAGTGFTAGRYQILSVSGNTATFDRAIGTGADATDGVGNLGGALDVPTSALLNLCVAGNSVWLYSGGGATGVTFSAAAAITVTAAGTAALPIRCFGYKSTHWETAPPIGDDRPTIAMGANALTLASYWWTTNLIFTGTAAAVLASGTYSSFRWCKVTNSSSTANRSAYLFDRSIYIDCEGIAPAGYAFGAASGYGATFIRCYAHDSKYGFGTVPSNSAIFNCICDSCYYGISFTIYLYWQISNCTFRNCYIGLYLTTGQGHVDNCIFADCYYGAYASGSNLVTRFSGVNNWYNNAYDVTNVVKGLTDTASNPNFVSELASGTDGATNSAPGTTFTSVSAPFSGVTTGDFLVVKAGAGATVAVYAITAVNSSSSLTLGSSPGNSLANVTFGVVKGSNNSLGAGSACIGAGAGILYGVS